MPAGVGVVDTYIRVIGMFVVLWARSVFNEK